MSAMAPEGPPSPPPVRRRRTVRLRTLLVCLAVVPTVAMGTQTAVTAQRLLAQSEHLRADVEAGERIGVPLVKLMNELQAERAMTAARWAGSPVTDEALRDKRAETDRAAAEFRRISGTGSDPAQGSEHSPDGPGEGRLDTVSGRLDPLASYRRRVDAHTGSAEQAVGYYTGVIDDIIRAYQDEFSHPQDADLGQESRPAVSLFSATEMVAREDTALALAGPSRELAATGFSQFLDAVGTHRYLYDTWIVPYLPPAERASYDKLIASQAWQTKLRIENAVIANHKDTATGVKLPADVAEWPDAYRAFAPALAALNTARARSVFDDADARASELQAEVSWLIAASGGALLLVTAVVVLTTRSVLRRLNRLHTRTVAIAEKTLPDVVARLQRGEPVDEDALPAVRGRQDEVGQIADAFARVVAASVDGHRQLAAERHGFGLFASGIASRTGNLVSRQLSLTEDLQDTFGHDEALLAQLMRSDQLTVGMRRQIENLLILAGGEIPDPHTEPMRVADLLREAAAEVEDFRRIERQALDEASVQPHAISQISHLLAELLDNATRFSPPRSKVVVRAELVADGLSVEIEDRGPRVSPAGYEAMNERLHSAPPYSVLAENAHRLGLFVVGHLADQLQARVTLRRSVYGGTAAVVILPSALLAPAAGEPEPRRRPAPQPRPAPVPDPVRLPVRERAAETGPEAGDPPAGATATAAPAPLPAPRGPALPTRATAPADPRPALPERVPQTHLTRQLRGPRAPEPDAGRDAATPEEVADAWADYEEGTKKVEAELGADQP
ncbi:signal transduction histidine kinase [Streptomyces sp. 3211.6]|uniref:sensor histidine kinase n=1 Tax=Streptomyces TaxID=1883 RepID=UPI0009A53A58|nr:MULTISPECIES: sensor histidine kinase [Streptomyces]RKT08552.1 signal transduction histidine kinase [Streptomyces sp. 3211.6]RPF29949.1 signal transduction histidine kinase [Streptomyces sp. Ag109_G2-6]